MLTAKCETNSEACFRSLLQPGSEETSQRWPTVGDTFQFNRLGNQTRNLSHFGMVLQKKIGLDRDDYLVQKLYLKLAIATWCSGQHVHCCS